MVAPVTIAWPHGRSAAVVITVAFEAELAILSVAPDATDRAKSLSVGTYGATRGVPRLLAELARRGTPSTWFVPSALLERYPEQVGAIRDAGHELANCGVALEDFGAVDTAVQLAMVRRAQEAFQHSLGVLPTGFRVGRGEMSPGLPAALEAEGFTWTSSLRGDDRPHFHAAPAGRLVEIPQHHQLDDGPYFAFNLDPPIPPGSPRIAPTGDVLDNWVTEFDAYHAEGLCFVLTLHPELIATPGRIGMLAQFLDHVHNRDVWLATAGEVARFWGEHGPANPPEHPVEVYHRIIGATTP